MFGRAFRLFRVHGIDVRADVSWLVILLLVAWSFWARFVVLHERSAWLAVPMAATATVLLFGSVIAHELAHALEARRRGVHVGGITLFLFGGATETRFDVRRPIDELALTAAGPLVSLALSGLLGLVAYAAGWGGATVVAETVGVVAWLNLALALFNLLPGAPLDGGRILRALVWHRTGDRRRATLVAADAGRVIAMLLVSLGLLLFLTVAGFLGGLWLVFIGWFLFRAASGERWHAEVEGILATRRVGQLAARVSPVPASTPVAVAVDEWFTVLDVDAVPVSDHGRVVAVLDVDGVRTLPAGRRAAVPAADVARPVDELPHVDEDEPATALLDALARAPLAVVTEGGHVVGTVTRARLVAWLERLRRLGGPSPSGRSRNGTGGPRSSMG